MRQSYLISGLGLLHALEATFGLLICCILPSVNEVSLTTDVVFTGLSWVFFVFAIGTLILFSTQDYLQHHYHLGNKLTTSLIMAIYVPLVAHRICRSEPSPKIMSAESLQKVLLILNSIASVSYPCVLHQPISNIV